MSVTSTKASGKDAANSSITGFLLGAVAFPVAPGNVCADGFEPYDGYADAGDNVAFSTAYWGPATTPQLVDSTGMLRVNAHPLPNTPV